MKRKKTYLLAFAATVATMFVISMPVRASETDDGIVSAFQNSYNYKTYLKDDAIKAQAKEGVVTLTGTVADESNKALAQETVASLPGVIRVDNQLDTKAEEAAEKSDTWIDRKLRLALLLHWNVSVRETYVEVKDGIVTLKGEASNLAQKDLTTEYAKDIDGVKDVINKMTVAETPAPAERTAGEKLDDASITAQVKLALGVHRSTSALKTKVTTQRGEVTLTGIAANAAEKSLVTKLVTDIQGVTSVNNAMTVAESKTK